MRALVWLTPETVHDAVDAARALLPDAELTLLVVEDERGEVVEGALAGDEPTPPAADTAPPGDAKAPPTAPAELVAAARARAGAELPVLERRGCVEAEVVAAAAGFDALLVVRDGDRAAAGPRSLGPPARYVVDHAPCPVLLAWPSDAPASDSLRRP